MNESAGVSVTSSVNQSAGATASATVNPPVVMSAVESVSDVRVHVELHMVIAPTPLAGY